MARDLTPGELLDHAAAQAVRDAAKFLQDAIDTAWARNLRVVVKGDQCSVHVEITRLQTF